MLLLLAVAGASVDAVVILGFGVLTAAQTGNTILLAAHLAQGQFASGLSSAVSVLGYMIGAAVGELVIVGRRDSASWPSAVGWTLVAELVPLDCLLSYWHLAGPNPGQERLYKGVGTPPRPSHSGSSGHRDVVGSAQTCAVSRLSGEVPKRKVFETAKKG
jgi:hypothetical protein